MNRLILATFVAITATAAFAQDRMTRTSCQEAYEAIMELASPNDPDVGLQMQFMRITPDAWCQFRRSDPGFDNLPFATIEWRMEGTARWTRDGIAPLAVEVRIKDLDVPDQQVGSLNRRPPLDIEATLRQIPDAGLVVLERAVAFNDAGDRLSVSGVFERVFLSSPSMMQVSMGSATFKAGLMTLTLEGTHENPFGFEFDVELRGNSRAQQQAAFDGISSLPEGLMDDATRAELMAFAGDLPKPIGTLEVNVASERGLGLMQIGMSMYSSFVSVMEDGTVSNEMDILFDGLSVTADWSPSAQVSD